MRESYTILSLFLCVSLCVCVWQHISAEDERTVQQFMPTDVKPRRVLADIIMERIREKETEINSKMSDTQS